MVDHKKILLDIIDNVKQNNKELKLETILSVIHHIDPNFLDGIRDDFIHEIELNKSKKHCWNIKEASFKGKNQYDGFENERLFHEVLWGAHGECSMMKASTVRMIFSFVIPHISKTMFKPRPCIRKLKYIGFPEDQDEHPVFIVGKVYRSIDFTGATYSFKEFNNGEDRIGLYYFEWIK